MMKGERAGVSIPYFGVCAKFEFDSPSTGCIVVLCTVKRIDPATIVANEAIITTEYCTRLRNEQLIGMRFRWRDVVMRTYSEISDGTKNGDALFLDARGFRIVLSEEVADTNRDMNKAQKKVGAVLSIGVPETLYMPKAVDALPKAAGLASTGGDWWRWRWRWGRWLRGGGKVAVAHGIPDQARQASGGRHGWECGTQGRE